MEMAVMEIDMEMQHHSHRQNGQCLLSLEFCLEVSRGFDTVASPLDNGTCIQT